MIYRSNLALQPRFTSIESAHAHLLCEAVVRHLALDGVALTERFRQRAAAHLLDEASQSVLLADAHSLATICEALWRRWLPQYPLAAIGSGRRYARDCGGRIASAVNVWAGGAAAEVRSLPTGVAVERFGYWQLAHPEVAAALGELAHLVRLAALGVEGDATPWWVATIASALDALPSVIEIAVPSAEAAA